MTGQGSANTRRIAAGVMGIMLLAVVLFSSIFVVSEADHDCSGENCPICACIAQWEQSLHQMGDGTAAMAASVLPAFAVFLSIVGPVFLLIRETLISRRVRMNH